ncbi:MAG: hypothetical protein AB1413_03015 [Thermodesulfobacteriota bacterium]
MGVLLGGLCSLFLLELALQGIEASPLWRVLPVIEPILGQPDRDIGYSFTPGTTGTWVREHRARIRINSLGLRDGEVAVSKQPGVLRVALTGDSMIEALQVEQEQTFESLAERKLTAAGRPAEIVNLAMSGNGPLRQLVRLERFGYPLAPDLVVSYASVFDFFSGELLRDDQNPGYVATSSGEFERGYGFRNRWQVRYVDTIWGRSFVGLLQHSAVARMLYLRSRDPWQRILGLPAAASPARGVEHDPCAASVLRSLEGLWLAQQPDELHWRATSRFLDDLAASTAAAQVPVLYLMADIPMPDPTCVESVESRGKIVKAMADAFASRGLGFVDWNQDLAKVMRKEQGGGGEGISDAAGIRRQEFGGASEFPGP